MNSTDALNLTGMTPAEKEGASVLVDAVDRCTRMIATIEALKASLLTRMAALAHEVGERSINPDGVDYSRRSMAAEIAAATRIHPATAKREMEEAEALTHNFPHMHSALFEGDVSVKHTRAIMDAAANLDPLRRAIFDKISAPIAAEMTPGDLGRIAKVRAADMAGATLEQRHEWARKRRYASITDHDDGMSTLKVFGPSLELHGVYDRVTTLAKTVKHDRTRVRDEYRRVIGHNTDDDCDTADCLCRTLAGTISADNESAVGASMGTAPTGSGTIIPATESDAITPPTGADAAPQPLPGMPAQPRPGMRAATFTPEKLTAATDHRSLDQVRVDILIDLLLGAEPTGHELHAAGGIATLEKIRADVQVTIPVTMMIGADGDVGTRQNGGNDSPAGVHTSTTRSIGGDGAADGASPDIDAYSGTTPPLDMSKTGSAWLGAGTLISPTTVKHLAGTSPGGWDRIFYRPDTGRIEHVDQYRPTSWQRRTLIDRDLTCRFPGCTVPARKTDIDHTHAFAEGGRTTIANLACLCEAHHVMKHQSDWQLRQLPYGVIEWTSPSGKTYTEEPPSRVFFRDSNSSASDDDPPPWSTQDTA